MAQASGHALLVLIDDILDLTKIEARKLSLEKMSFNLRDTVENVMRLIQVQAQAKDLLLHSNVGNEIPAVLSGDASRLRQVLINLTANAVKFTDRGVVELHATLESCSGHSITVRFTVTDTGIGISSDQVGLLFSPFVQADSSTTRKYGGTGLGLAISKQLAELMGGTIGVESREGHGSSFWFTAVFDLVQPGEPLPTCPRPDEPVRVPANTSVSGRAARILVAEDNPTNRVVALAQLHRLGYSASAVTNGAEAIEVLQREEFDLVLMDCQMPVLDGFQATGRIRRSDRSGIPIVAMTAGAMQDDRERCLREGMDDYIAKPVELSMLQRVLSKWLPVSNPDDAP